MTSYLLDTNVLIFFLENSPRLPEKIAEIIETPDSLNLVSYASLWEISIKASIGKLDVDYADRADLPEMLSSNGFHLLPIEWPAMHRAAELPMHHRDPFDRLLIAESLNHKIPILSCDSQLDAYGIERIW